MTADTIQSNKILSNEVEDTKCYESHLRKVPNKAFGQPSMISPILQDKETKACREFGKWPESAGLQIAVLLPPHQLP